MSFKLEQASLLEFLNERGLKPQLQPETNIPFVLFKIREVDTPVFLRINEDSPLLQVVAYLPYELQDEGLNETARTLHLLNKELDMPGFGMDEREGLLFYRSVIPAVEGEINADLLASYLGTLRFACETFMQLMEQDQNG